MITGFNTNVRHRNLLFHVQTEDSGIAHPHLISHVYYGGTILASEKSDYSDRVNEEDLGRVVRVLMEAQHKSMIGRLERGEFDAAICERIPGQGPSPSQLLAQTAPVTDTPVPEDIAEPGATASTGHLAEAEMTRERPVAAAPAPLDASAPGAGATRPFGEGIVSQKPLDEVILEYLVEKARSPRRG